MKKAVVALIVLAMVLAAGGTAIGLLFGGGGTGDPRVDSTPTSEPSDQPPPADPDAIKPPSPELEPFYAQTLQWEACDTHECATLEVPIDYGKADGETIEIALLKVPASGEKIGSMVVNPGGPGSPGTQYAARAEQVFGDPLRDNFDIVGFDPRGTGDSDPIDCLSDEQLGEYLSADPEPDSDAEAQAVEQAQEDFFAGCVVNSDSLIGHVTTAETARDMDVLRAALGETELTYFGASYGTKLGATYAELFPKRVGRLVLDGAVDVSLPARELSLGQAAGFETALTAYVQNCVDTADNCFLGEDAEEGLGTIKSLLAEIDEKPLPTNQDRDLTVGNAFYGVITPLYNKDFWYILDQALGQALDGEGSTLLLLSDLNASRDGDTYADNSAEAILAINCLDDPYAIGPEEVPAEFAAFEAASPTFGRVFAWGLMGCRGIQVESSEPELDITGEGAKPIVVVGTTRDPATPYEWAVGLSEELESGVLVSRDGDGHTAYNSGNKCIVEALESYLVAGTVPEDGLEC
ncbi:alpha/beta hydrolase [Nocardioides salsibiostraticola]